MWLYTCTYTKSSGLLCSTCIYLIVSYFLMNDSILTAAIMIQGDYMELILIN